MNRQHNENEEFSSPKKRTLICSKNSSNALCFSELWEYRELYYFLALRDIKVRYKQTLLGIAWVVLQPLLTMLVFNIFFSRFAPSTGDAIPYSIFALSGLVPWVFFSNCITQACNSLVGDANLVQKVYFPRLIIPTSKVSSSFVDFLLSLTLLFLITLFYGITPSLRFVLFPFWIAYLILFTSGLGIWLSGLNLLFRDIKQIIPFATQLGLFATPIAYPISIIPEKWQLLYGLNPMVGIIETFRWILLDGYTLTNTTYISVLFSISISLITFLTGIRFFKNVEKTCADIV